MALIPLFLLGLIALLTGVYFYIKHNYTYWRKRGVPYLEPSFPFGNIRAFNRILHSSQRIGRLYDQLKGKGPFAGIYLFHQPVVLATDLDFVKTVLIKDFNSFRDRGMYFNERDDPLTGNLFSVDGPKWRQLRLKLTPTFTSSKMKFMFPIIVEVGEQLQIALRKQFEQSPEVEIKDILARYTTDVIGTCAFGIECNSLKDPQAEFRVMGKKVFDTPRSGIFKRIFMATSRDLAKKLKLKRYHDDVSEFFMKVVREAINLRKDHGVQRNDFMDLLIQLMDTGKIKDDPDSEVGKITFEQLAAQAFVFFLAGFETSSNSMAYVLYELALNQDIQDKARKSIDETLKKHDGQLTYESLMEMTYIHQIVYGMYPHR